MARATWCSSCWRALAGTAARRGATGGRRGGPKGDFGIECYHVNARLSKKLEDIGDLRLGKFLLLLGYCLQAIWCRFRYGVTNFYYIPAPGKRSALYRDWVVMLICRPFFKRVILHWHAAGLAKWLEMVVTMRSRSLTYRLMKQVDLSIVLSKYNRADAEKLFSQRGSGREQRHSRSVPRGLRTEVLPRRRARFAARRKLLSGATLEAADLRDTGGRSATSQGAVPGALHAREGIVRCAERGGARQPAAAQRQAPVSLRLLVAGRLRHGGRESRV